MSFSLEFTAANIDLSKNFEFNLEKVDVVLHTAAQTSTNRAYTDPLADLNTNVGGLIRIIENYRKQKIIPFVLFLGNATQIGMTNNLEEAKYKKCDQPITFYDLSKNTAENYLLQYINANVDETFGVSFPKFIKHPIADIPRDDINSLIDVG